MNKVSEIQKNLEQGWAVIHLSYEPTRYIIFPSGEIQTIVGGVRKKKKSFIDNFGYEKVKLNWDGKKYYKRVHIYMGRCFMPNPLNLPEINHKDLDKSNNSLSNLEWVTKSKNAEHAYLNGKNKIVGGYKMDKAKKVGKYLNDELVKEYPSTWQVRNDGFPRVSVSRAIVSGKLYRGFNWRYL